jgi:hypothetical protein
MPTARTDVGAVWQRDRSEDGRTQPKVEKIMTWDQAATARNLRSVAVWLDIVVDRAGGVGVSLMRNSA